MHDASHTKSEWSVWFNLMNQHFWAQNIKIVYYKNDKICHFSAKSSCIQDNFKHYIIFSWSKNGCLLSGNNSGIFFITYLYFNIFQYFGPNHWIEPNTLFGHSVPSIESRTSCDDGLLKRIHHLVILVLKKKTIGRHICIRAMSTAKKNLEQFNWATKYTMVYFSCTTNFSVWQF